MCLFRNPYGFLQKPISVFAETPMGFVTGTFRNGSKGSAFMVRKADLRPLPTSQILSDHLQAFI